MASVCLTERGDCLQDLGRLDEAATAYEETIRWDQQRGGERDVAAGKVQLGSVRVQQRRFRDALNMYTEAREQFTRLGELGTVAVVWHQMGIAHQDAGQPDAAEDAYRQSLAIKVQIGDVRGQARTLGQLGTLYNERGRLEEAASLFRRSGDHFVTLEDTQLEGRSLSNLGDTLCQLRRWDEARQVIHRAIECKAPFGHAAEPWTAWAVLAKIETGAGQTDLAAQAKARARDCYLAYRRDGGENHFADGDISLAVTPKLLAGNASGAIADLDEMLASPDLPDWLRQFVVALRVIADGSRDRNIAEAPDLLYRLAAELLWVIDALER